MSSKKTKSSTVSPERSVKTSKTSECAACEGKLEKRDAVCCVLCKNTWHMTKRCSGYSKAAFEENPKLVRTFQCDECSKDSSTEEVTDSENDVPRRSSGKDSLNVVLEKIVEMDKKLDKKLGKFQAVIDMFSDQIDVVTDLRKQVSEMQTRIRKLEQAPKAPEEKHREVIICNVPPLENEDVIKVAGAIFAGVEAEIEPEDVVDASRF